MGIPAADLVNQIPAVDHAIGINEM
jgi:hypothetical protein